MNVDQRSMWEYIVQLYAHKSLSSSQRREISLSVGVMNTEQVGYRDQDQLHHHSGRRLRGWSGRRNYD